MLGAILTDSASIPSTIGAVMTYLTQSVPIGVICGATASLGVLFFNGGGVINTLEKYNKDYIREWVAYYQRVNIKVKAKTAIATITIPWGRIKNDN